MILTCRPVEGLTTAGWVFFVLDRAPSVYLCYLCCALLVILIVDMDVCGSVGMDVVDKEERAGWMLGRCYRCT